MKHEFKITDNPDLSLKSGIADPLLAYNVALLGSPNIRPLVILLHSKDSASVVGGLWGRTSFGWLFIELFFIPDKLRSKGLGTQLLESAEAEAKQRGCKGAWLDTFNVAAARFYEKQGYRPFGVIDDYPPGATRHFLLKLL